MAHTSRLEWYATADGGAYTRDGRFAIDNLDNGYVLLCCRRSGLRKLCANMTEAMQRAKRAAYGIPHQLT